MTYDVAHRFAQALDPSALSTITATLHAIEAARRDCRGAGRNDENDPAVLLLARHLGKVAAADRPADAALRADCATAIAALRRSPALKVLVAASFTGDPRAKSTFHAEGAAPCSGSPWRLGWSAAATTCAPASEDRR